MTDEPEELEHRERKPPMSLMKRFLLFLFIYALSFPLFLLVPQESMFWDSITYAMYSPLFWLMENRSFV